MKCENMKKISDEYSRLMDSQYAAYEMYARKHSLTAKELFVIYMIWFSPNGCLQTEICERLSITKPTVNAIIRKLMEKGYVSLTESKADRRNKIIKYTKSGKNYAEKLIEPMAAAEAKTMNCLSDKDAAELMRLTALYTNYLKERLEKLK